ncbi:unnamed protein product [Spirodela intermedia]|uniref:Uncharacterized protein n=1 Tax=Spirodela intermedia TaxID=51605 RepID=A0A7I8IMV6_SPIIN|nr:unnamed protein product [Spirodela intermedia]CAA6659198.1 unnamed protein product [Spirodela intermedia]
MDRRPLEEVLGSKLLTRPHTSSRQCVSICIHSFCGDRFIPDRSAMDFDMAYYLLTETKKEKRTPPPHLAETLLPNRSRILAFKAKPPSSSSAQEISSDQALCNQQSKPSRQRRYIPQSAERTLDAPDIQRPRHRPRPTVYLWDAADGSTAELTTAEDDVGPVTSVSWAPDGRHLALLRTLRGSPISSWGAVMEQPYSDDGGMDGMVVNNDVRRPPAGGLRLKWSGSGGSNWPAGGNDNLLHIWDLSASSSSSGGAAASRAAVGQNAWLHRFDDHMAAVKALAWCPFQSNLLASGGGGGDRCIKFWNTHTGACLNSVDTGSQVCSLLWSKNERELLSSHGFTQNQLTLWKYPPCCLGSGDETLRFWNVFGTPESAAQKPAKAATNPAPFSSFNHIR